MTSVLILDMMVRLSGYYFILLQFYTHLGDLEAQGVPCDLSPMWESSNHRLNEDLHCAPSLLGHLGDPLDHEILGKK